jgi:hypothetical protein
MSGGGGAQGETRYNWNDDMAPRWNNLLNTAMWQGFTQNPDGSMAVRDRETYTGERFAPLQYDQTAAGSNIRSLNDQSLGTISVGNNARKEIDKTLSGGYLQGNPYIGGNQHANQNTVTDRNMFAGNNPYFRDTMLSGMEDITNAYQRGTAADTKSAFTRAGVFGGSAHENAVANNEAGLGKNLSQFADSMLNQQYNRSAGLEDSYLGRDVQNQQYNRSTSSGLAENQLNRGFQGYEGERGRMGNAVGQGQNEQAMALQRAQAQMDVGSMFQNQGQKQNDYLFDQWNQTMNHPYSVLGNLSSLYGQAMGGGGMTQSVYGGGPSNAQLGIGAGLGLMSMFGQGR